MSVLRERRQGLAPKTPLAYRSPAEDETPSSDPGFLGLLGKV